MQRRADGSPLVFYSSVVLLVLFSDFLAFYCDFHSLIIYYIYESVFFREKVLPAVFTARRAYMEKKIKNILHKCGYCI